MRYTQPQSGPLTLDLGNPLTRGLSIVQTGDANGPFTNINGVTGVTTKLGRAKKFISASSQYLSAPNGAISPTSLTFLVIGSVNSATVNSALISMGAASNDRVLLYVSSAGGLATFSGQGATTGQATLAGNVAAGQTYIFGGRVNGASFRDNWINGVQQSSDATAVTPAACSTLAVGAYYTSGVPTAGFYLDGSVTLALAWNRPLSDAEMRSVAANPWQIFRSPQRVMLAAAGGTDTPINPGVGALALTGYAPSITQSANLSLTPGTGSIGITGYAPTIAQPHAVNPGVGLLAITGYAPTVTQAANQAVTPGTGSLALTGYAPAVTQTAGQWVAPGAGSLTISGFAPTITQPQTVAPGLGSLVITGYAPTVTQAINQSIVPGAGTLALSGYAPSIAQSANQLVLPAAGSLLLTGYAPLVAQSVNQSIAPSVGSLTITGFAPVIAQVSASPNLQPGAGMLLIVGYAPTVEQLDPSASVGGGGAGDWRSVRDFADRLDKVHTKPTKAAKKLRRKQIEEEVLELLPDEPESRLIAPVIAQAVYRKEAQVIARWTPTKAMQPIAPSATVAEQAEAMEAEARAAEFDAAEAIRAMVEQWQKNEAIARELEREAEEESEVEMLLLG